MSTPHSSADAAYLALKERLLGREFIDGQRLKETSLAAELGVSRTPLRQALHRLVAEGWLEQAPNQGVRVKEWTLQDVENIFEIRLLLEPHAASAAALHRSAQQLEQLRNAAEEVARCLDETDETAVARRSEANNRFHETILQAAGNPRLANILAGVVQFAMVAWTYRTFRNTDARRSSAHHFELVDAIEAGDADWARAVMTAHIAAARRSVLTQLNHPTSNDSPKESHDS